MRHGESVWNKANIFTGWVDVPLSDQGIDEALSAGAELADIEFDCIFMSTLMRAQQTAMLAMSKNNTHKTPIRVDHDSDIQDQFHIYCGYSCYWQSQYWLQTFMKEIKILSTMI